jgi:hypothetical protein
MMFGNCTQACTCFSCFVALNCKGILNTMLYKSNLKEYRISLKKNSSYAPSINSKPGIMTGPNVQNIQMWSALLWDITQCTVPYQYFGTNYLSHLQGSRNPRRKLVHNLPFSPPQILTWTLQWMEAPKIFDNPNMPSSHTAWCSSRWREKGAAINHNVSAKKRKILNKYENIAFGGWGVGVGLINYFQIFASCCVLEPNVCVQWGTTVQEIVNETNCYASLFRNSKHNIFSIRPKVNNWQPATAQEIYTVLAFFMLMGTVQKPSIRSYSTWNQQVASCTFNCYFLR